MYREQVDAEAPLAVPIPTAIPIIVLEPNAWRSSLFACKHLYPNGPMAWYCPCVALAQIAGRVGVCGGYHRVLCGVMGLIVSGLLLYAMSETVLDSEASSAMPVCSHQLLQTLALLCFLTVAVVLGAVRTRVRGVYYLVGSELEDHVASICCFWCTLVQLGAEIDAFTPEVCSFGARDTLPSYSV
ncbi:hypothetical protein SDRG_00588 [Saprolegnia diclina VS20]|uniref:Uncharacterized protein n=1 Tax=Saprolegnia diclina (strain VS20) TaxID=1156394 RepID=T0QX96_SAPDV|nr:hypothetical protein SDRG_00588 [Saprolegnia diclina VS20]EQC42869.1 hypothetical protein SDRG_00588 [Saprolegnia diclina VS20]|eukprot:XP_008604292.1 hypothetical protein SDRG_00588 [Saprolegnia diclina VS20]